MCLSFITDGELVKNLKLIEGITCEHVASFAYGEVVLTIHIDKSAEEFQLHTRLTIEMTRFWSLQTEHATDASIGHVEVMLPEAQIELDAELGIEISVELTIGIPSLPSWLTADVGAVNCST